MNKEQLTELYRKYFRPLEGIAMFIGITLVIHYVFRIWAYQLNFVPVTSWVADARIWLSELAFRNTGAVLSFLGLDFTTANNTFIFESGNWLAINTGCSGVKQFLQAFFLYLLYPGKIKHKLWFVPLAMVLMHVANIIRLTGVGLTMYWRPEWFDFSHDYVFRFTFYLILFLLWIWWEEKYRLTVTKEWKRKARTHQNGKEQVDDNSIRR